MIKFNGTFTIENLEKGTHRTFKIHTQAEDANFAPGSRIISVMNGSDNNFDYMGIGFVNDNGIHVWKKHQGTQWEQLVRFAWLALTTEKFQEKIAVTMSKKCRRCNRKLTTPESLELGLGSVCAEKI